jgi:hypothetical protein
LPVIHTLDNSIWRKKKLTVPWNEFLIVPVYKKGNETDCNNYRGISLLSTSYKTLLNILLSSLSVGFDVTVQVLIRFFAFVGYK